MKKINMGQRGASALEFAIVLPFLLLVLFGIMEFGLLLFNKQVITNASREGARAGIVLDTPRLTSACTPSISQVVTTYCNGNLITFGTISTPVISCTSSGTSTGDDLTVAVSYRYDFLLLPNFINALSGFLGSSTLNNGLNLNASTIMKYE